MWTEDQKIRVSKALAEFTVNDPMIVSEEMWYDLKENNMLDRERTLIMTKDGLLVRIPWKEGVLWKPKGPVQ